MGQVDRLNPAVLRRDAQQLLQMNEGRIDALVYDLLREARLADERVENVRKGHSHDVQYAEKRADEAEQERNEYREALRLVKRATRHIRVGRW